MDYNLTIKDLPKEERPREKLCKFGTKAMSTAELLALIIRTGSQSDTAIELANKLLTHTGGLKFIGDLSVEELQEVKGVGLAKAAQISATVELGRRIRLANQETKEIITSPQDVANLLLARLSFLEKEHFVTLLLNTKNEIISIEDISIGSLSNSIVHPREVFKPAIRRSSAAVILAHNHPSGNPEPSKEDIDITQRIKKAGKILGIEVLDHLVIGNKDYISLKEKGYFK
ncbi:RadC family protein [Acetohalobium arabaticum]|uniref:DNA replication and repair protein RadC n=1 Tax=Acetohalobium arabaticum (strain ATCC 49924 / DSM 5501 / Z-7288) TaxID=574087 RepID=D9QV39_ACEAZ|nr:DNA repair protein RadC [Acetohalobium arabaticum]ADL12098.1 DNA replication and repair protein RadC [Acetohalobium arabaticum DSM 5501]